jgi:hypothetical protein
MGVYHPHMETIDLENDHSDEIFKLDPMLSFDSFYYLLDYFKKNNITFSTYNTETQGTRLFLIPDGLNYNVDLVTEYINTFESESVKKIVIQGTMDTIFLNKFIPLLPQGKKMSYVPLFNWRFSNLSNKYDALVFLGEINEYTIGNAVNIFTEDNFLAAPPEFIEKNKSFFPERTLKKLNKVLPTTILKDRDKRIQ